MDLNFDQPENTILGDDEEINDTGGFVDTYNDQFNQLRSTTEQEPVTSQFDQLTSATEEEFEITEEQLERIRQNMEKAKRLREEKLRKTREGTQSTLEAHNQTDTHVTENHQFNSANVSAENGQNNIQVDTRDGTVYTQMDIEQIESCEFNSENIESSAGKHDNICDVQEFEQSEPNNTNYGEDNEDDIDNILDFINIKNSSEISKAPDEKQTDRDNCTTLIQIDRENSQIEDENSEENDLREKVKIVTNINDKHESQENIDYVEDSGYKNPQTALEEST